MRTLGHACIKDVNVKTLPCQSECPVCGDAESYINHRHHCWEKDRLDRFYNFRIPEEKEKYLSRLCDSCREGKHDCRSGKKCFCPYYGCAIERKDKFKWELKKLKSQLESNTEDLTTLKSRIKSLKKEIKTVSKELA